MMGSKIPNESRLKIIINGIMVENAYFFKIRNHFSPAILILINHDFILIIFMNIHLETYFIDYPV
jgi:hypothetical protein